MLIFPQLSVVNLDAMKSVKVRILLEIGHGNWHGSLGFTDGSVVKNLPANTGEAGLISGSERFPGGGNGNPLQYSHLENPMGRGALQARVHGAARAGND